LVLIKLRLPASVGLLVQEDFGQHLLFIRGFAGPEKLSAVLVVAAQQKDTPEQAGVGLGLSLDP